MIAARSGIHNFPIAARAVLPVDTSALLHLAKDRPATMEEMKEAVKRHAAERFKDMTTRYPQEQAEKTLRSFLSSRKGSR